MSRPLVALAVAALVLVAFLAGLAVSRPARAGDRAVVCSEPFISIAGSEKWRTTLTEFLAAQVAAGKTESVPLTVSGTTVMICTW